MTNTITKLLTTEQLNEYFAIKAELIRVHRIYTIYKLDGFEITVLPKGFLRIKRSFEIVHTTPIVYDTRVPNMLFLETLLETIFSSYNNQ